MVVIFATQTKGSTSITYTQFDFEQLEHYPYFKAQTSVYVSQDCDHVQLVLMM